MFPTTTSAVFKPMPLFNPGSPTWKRMAPFPSMGLLWIEDGTVEGEIFPV